MFPTAYFNQAKTSSYFSKSSANPKATNLTSVNPDDINDIKKNNSIFLEPNPEALIVESKSILDKLESLCAKLANHDEIVAEFKLKQDEFFKSLHQKEDYFARPVEPQQTIQIPQVAPKSEPDKKKKKAYKKLTPDLVEKVYEMYPQFPKEVSELYTTDGQDLYALHKNKKVPIENLGSVLSLLK